VEVGRKGFKPGCLLVLPREGGKKKKLVVKGSLEGGGDDSTVVCRKSGRSIVLANKKENGRGQARGNSNTF